MEDQVTNETVVEATVDAGQEVKTDEVVTTPIVDEKPDNVGEAIKKEVDRREAQLKQKYEQDSKTNAQQARDALIAEEGMTWNGKPITTESDYRQMLREAEIEKEYKDRELPPEIVQELVDAKKFRDEAEPQLTQIRSEKKQAADFKAFYEAYPDAKAEDIPATVWTEYANGKDLVDSFARHENASLKQKLAEFEQKKQIEQLNQANAESSTGSLTGNGTVATAHFTQEQVANMSLAETNKNWSAINESMKKW